MVRLLNERRSDKDTMARGKGAAAPAVQAPVEEEVVDLTGGNGVEAPVAEAPAAEAPAAPAEKVPYDVTKLAQPKPGDKEWLAPGTTAQHRHTGEVFEVRKVRANGLVVIKITRSTPEKGEHFNTYTVKKDHIVPVGSAVEEKPAPAPKAPKAEKPAKGPAATKAGKVAGKLAPPAERRRPEGLKTFMVVLRPNGDKNEKPIRLKVDAADEAAARTTAQEAVDARKGKSIPDADWQVTEVTETEA